MSVTLLLFYKAICHTLSHLDDIHTPNIIEAPIKVPLSYVPKENISKNMCLNQVTHGYMALKNIVYS